MLGGGEVLRGLDLRHYVGVFDARMTRIYKFIGSSPSVIGASGAGRDRISAGLWHLTEADRQRVARRAHLSPDIAELWFRRAGLTSAPIAA
jgi:acyl homoserine lactone synthase